MPNRWTSETLNQPNSGNGPLIAVRGLGKTYVTYRGEFIEALANINFSISDGEFLAVVGPSGCGKSTLLKLIAGLIPHTSGEILINGTFVHGPRRDLGTVFQEALLLPWRTVLQNVLVPVEVQGLDRERHLRRSRELLELVGLTSFENKYPSELSGGMQQRVAICRALVHDPSLLLMDEPFGALDAMTREYMNLELQRLWLEAKKTVFFITHSIPEAVFLADRVLVLSARPGRLVEDLRIDFPRPRDLDLITSDAFGVYTRKIRLHIASKGGLE